VIVLQQMSKEKPMKKAVRTLLLATTILAGFAATSHAMGLSGAPAPVPAGTPR
jgi:TolA-binding protein